MTLGERAWNPQDWDRLVRQIARGRCTPFLGAGACGGTLPVGAELGRVWADRYKYPFGGEIRLHEVMQYASIIEKDAVAVKELVTSEFEDLGEPDYSNPFEPHRLLAGFPITVYLTTNYDDFMTRALERVHRQPVARICPWYGEVALRHSETGLPKGYQPTVEEPLVYHLHGSFRHSASLVLAEQDYVEFLVNLAKDFDAPRPQVIPAAVLPALTGLPLLFIGYSLRDWSFRMLFHGLVRAVPEALRRRHVSVQLAPEPDDDESTRRRAENYLTRYFDRLNISVYWGTAEEFCSELGGRLGVVR